MLLQFDTVIRRIILIIAAAFLAGLLMAIDSSAVATVDPLSACPSVEEEIVEVGDSSRCLPERLCDRTHDGAAIEKNHHLAIRMNTLSRGEVHLRTIGNKM